MIQLSNNSQNSISMKFILKNEQFSIDLLLGNKVDDTEVQRLIQTLGPISETYIVHDPLPEDINFPTDLWSCHDAEAMGIIFEFIEGQLLYLLINPLKIELTGIIDSLSSQKHIVHFTDGEFEFFGSKQMIVEGKIPNRYVEYLNFIRSLYL